MLVRKVTVADAESLLALMYRLDEETKFMLLEPGERQTTVAEQREFLESLEDAANKALFVAVDQERVIGFVIGIGQTASRNRHSMYCVIGVEQASVGKGIGKQLLSNLEAWALENRFSRMELTVMCHNERAQRLYQSQGFEVEGIKRRSLLVDGAYVDEFYMSKLLPEQPRD